MAFKFIVFFAALACVNAGGLIGAPVAHYSPAAAVSSAYISTAPVAHAAYAAPVAHAAYAAPVAYAAPLARAYQTAPVAVHDPHYGATSQSVVRSLGGAGAVSHYSKAVDGAFSSVRKYDTRITNDGLTAYAHAPVAAYAAPVAHTYAQTYAAPVAHAAYAAPVAHAAYAAPVAHATYAAPAAYATQYASPVVKTVAPAAYAAPVVAKAAVAYSPAVAVSHTTFTGLGTSYGW